MDFRHLDMDKGLSEEQQKEWQSIFASYRSESIMTGRVAGIDVKHLTVRNEKTGRNEVKEVICLVVISYRVKVLIPEQEIWYSESTNRPSHVLRSMTGAVIDYVITAVDKENEICMGSRRKALAIRRHSFLRKEPEPGKKVTVTILAVGRSHLLGTTNGYDITLAPSDLCYGMIIDLRERFHTGEEHTALIKNYNDKLDKLAVSIKEVEPNPFDGAEVRHPIRSRRASIITGKYRGGVFCRLENNLDCLCTYSPHQYDEDFHIGDQVIVAITKYNYTRKQIYGKIVAKW